jgi:hypothetical protein
VVVVLVAIISLIGTIAASGAVTEWLKRRDFRESIKSDLEVWEKLPDGTAKEALLDHIQSRVLDLPRRDERPGLTPVVTGVGLVTWNVIYWSLMAINFGYHWVRDQRGVLYLYLGNDGPKLQLIVVVVILIAIVACGACGPLIGRYLAKLLRM